MRDPMWKEAGRRPPPAGGLARAPRAGLYGLLLAVVSALLLDGVLLTFFMSNLVMDNPSPTVLVGWLAAAWLASVLAFALSLWCAWRGSRTGDRRAFWWLLGGFCVLGVFVVLVQPWLLRHCGRQLPDELRARYCLVLGLPLGIIHALVGLAVVMLLTGPR